MICLTGIWQVCPECGGRLRRKRTRLLTDQVREAEAECKSCGEEFKIVESKPERKAVASTGAALA